MQWARAYALNPALLAPRTLCGCVAFVAICILVPFWPAVGEVGHAGIGSDLDVLTRALFQKCRRQGMENWVAISILDDLPEDADNLVPVSLMQERLMKAVEDLPAEFRAKARLRVLMGDARTYYEVGYFKW